MILPHDRNILLFPLFKYLEQKEKSSFFTSTFLSSRMGCSILFRELDIIYLYQGTQVKIPYTNTITFHYHEIIHIRHRQDKIPNIIGRI